MAEILGAALHVANVLLALALLFIYAQNYRKIKSKYTVGLIVFALFFLLQSAMGLYFDASMVMYYSAQAQAAAMVLEGIKAVALAVLLKISLE